MPHCRFSDPLSFLHCYTVKWGGWRNSSVVVFDGLILGLYTQLNNHIKPFYWIGYYNTASPSEIEPSLWMQWSLIKKAKLASLIHFLIIPNTNRKLSASKCRWQQLKWWHEAQFCIAAWQLLCWEWQARSYPTLLRGKATDRLETGERECPKHAGESGGRRSQEQECLEPVSLPVGMLQTSRPAVLSGCTQQNREL